MINSRMARLAGAAAAAVAMLTGAVLWASHGNAAAHLTPARDGQAGTTSLPSLNCESVNPVIGYIGAARPGAATQARKALGSALLAQVNDTASGILEFSRPPGGFWYPSGSALVPALSGARRSALFTRWLPVREMSRHGDLRSCLYLMNDRPQAQPLIRAAVAAVARSGYMQSAARLSAELQQVLISDNPLVRNSVIVTLMITGKAYRPIAKGAPTLHRTALFTAIMNTTTRQVTGTSEGGF